ERADPSCRSVEGFESEVAGGEIKLFVIKGIVRDVHLAINAALRAVGIEDDGRVVINTGRALLKQRCNQHNFILAGRGGKLLRCWTGNRFGKIKERSVFALTEILCLK